MIAKKPDPVKAFKRKLILFVLTVTAVSALVSMVVLSPEATHITSLIAMIAVLPLFILQVNILALVALETNWIILWVRSRKRYDEHGPVSELKQIQARIGTKEEKPHDSIAMGLQFFANSFLIGIVILCFFLMRSGASLG